MTIEAPFGFFLGIFIIGLGLGFLTGFLVMKPFPDKPNVFITIKTLKDGKLDKEICDAINRALAKIEGYRSGRLL